MQNINKEKSDGSSKFINSYFDIKKFKVRDLKILLDFSTVT
jgi:hypothetical protein